MLVARLKRDIAVWHIFGERPDEPGFFDQLDESDVDGGSQVLLKGTEVRVLCGIKLCRGALGEINITASPAPAGMAPWIGTYQLQAYFEPLPGFFPERPRPGADGYDRETKRTFGTRTAADIDIPAPGVILSMTRRAALNQPYQRWTKLGLRAGYSNTMIQHYPVYLRCPQCLRVSTVTQELLEAAKAQAVESLEDYVPGSLKARPLTDLTAP